jgi:hypothetical protein
MFDDELRSLATDLRTVAGDAVRATNLKAAPKCSKPPSFAPQSVDLVVSFVDRDWRWPWLVRRPAGVGRSGSCGSSGQIQRIR